MPFAALRWRLSLGALLLLSIYPATAQDQGKDPPELPPVKVVGTPAPGDGGINVGDSFFPGNAVTPTRGESPISQFGGSVTVIGPAQIINSQQPFLRDLLQTVPGLDFAQNGGPGRFGSVFLRGQSSRATKVLVDGIPLNDPSSPQRTFDFGAFSTLEVERVEVLRGPQSTLYGSDAVGGVINIITKKGEGPARASFSTMLGSYGTNENILTSSSGSKSGYYSVGVSWFDNTGFSVANQRYGRFFDTENDAFHQQTVSTRFGWTPAENFDVDVVLRYIHGTTALDSFNQPPFSLITDDTLAKTHSEQFYGRISTGWTSPGGFLESRVAYNRTQINRDFNDPNSAFPPTYSLFHGSTDKFEYQARLHFSENHTFTLGYDYLLESLDNPTTDPIRYQQGDSAFYLQDQIGLWDRWFTTAGIRHDEYEIAGPATTWRIASIFRLKETASAIHGSYGTGFIAPSLFELFANAPPFVLGNPKLQPEQARGFEYGFEQGIFENKLLLDMTYFRIDSDNLIQYTFPSFDNVSRARASGVECIATWKLTDSTRIIANYTNLATRDLDLDRPLQLRPRNKGSVTINQDFLNGRANWYLQFVAIGDRFDYSVPAPIQHMPAHAVVNTAMWYDLRPNLRLFARVDNLFNANYEDIVGYGTAGLSAYAGVKLTLGGPTR